MQHIKKQYHAIGSNDITEIKNLVILFRDVL